MTTNLSRCKGSFSAFPPQVSSVQL
uniref:Uncharacterized protein n=1 Tax=Anguilla anguilla TaxID=7936 RepID=A0A0E9Y0A8_ANGAN